MPRDRSNVPNLNVHLIQESAEGGFRDRDVDDGLDLKPDASGTLKPGSISAGDSFEFTYLTTG